MTEDQPQIWVQTLIGQNAEPFLAAALRSVSWADGFTVVNTDPEGRGLENELVVRRTVERGKLKLQRLSMSANKFDFAAARNKSLEQIPDGAYVLIVDSDEVYFPEWEAEARRLINLGHDTVTSHYYHLAVYKDLLHSVRSREVLYKKTPDTHWERGIHELLVHPRVNPAVADGRHGVHYGYIKPAREVARRWEFYRQLGAEIHDYDVGQPDHALDDWPRVCTPFWQQHPPAVRELLLDYPTAPPAPKLDVPCDVGLVLLTWDDSENLRNCLASLEHTTYPFELCVVDNGSLDESLELVRGFQERTGKHVQVFSQDAEAEALVRESLVQALNRGFGYFLERPGVEYVGWVHGDMTFDWPDWLCQLVRGLQDNPGYVKLGAWEVDSGKEDEPWPGNSQCYLVRKLALETVGLFNERFQECGGAEDWEHNHRLLKLGKVMITPKAMVHHYAMGTRRHHDNSEAARINMDIYHELVGSWDAPV